MATKRKQRKIVSPKSVDKERTEHRLTEEGESAEEWTRLINVEIPVRTAKQRKTAPKTSAVANSELVSSGIEACECEPSTSSSHEGLRVADGIKGPASGETAESESVDVQYVMVEPFNVKELKEKPARMPRAKRSKLKHRVYGRSLPSGCPQSPVVIRGGGGRSVFRKSFLNGKMRRDDLCGGSDGCGGKGRFSELRPVHDEDETGVSESSSRPMDKCYVSENGFTSSKPMTLHQSFDTHKEALDAVRYCETYMWKKSGDRKKVTYFTCQEQGCKAKAFVQPVKRTNKWGVFYKVQHKDHVLGKRKRRNFLDSVILENLERNVTNVNDMKTAIDQECRKQNLPYSDLTRRQLYHLMERVGGGAFKKWTKRPKGSVDADKVRKVPKMDRRKKMSIPQLEHCNHDDVDSTLLEQDIIKADSQMKYDPQNDGFRSDSELKKVTRRKNSGLPQEKMFTNYDREEVGQMLQALYTGVMEDIIDQRLLFDIKQKVADVWQFVASQFPPTEDEVFELGADSYSHVAAYQIAEDGSPVMVEDAATYEVHERENSMEWNP